mmetsp:Transcript_12867/g.26093  ORF Transcript_12867/g.26093 Transcript_12867/m.26093 type:complete len:87 (+) Transcript_12867:729-989(+)
MTDLNELESPCMPPKYEKLEIWGKMYIDHDNRTSSLGMPRQRKAVMVFIPSRHRIGTLIKLNRESQDLNQWNTILLTSINCLIQVT